MSAYAHALVRCTYCKKLPEQYPLFTHSDDYWVRATTIVSEPAPMQVKKTKPITINFISTN